MASTAFLPLVTGSGKTRLGKTRPGKPAAKLLLGRCA